MLFVESADVSAELGCAVKPKGADVGCSTDCALDDRVASFDAAGQRFEGDLDSSSWWNA